MQLLTVLYCTLCLFLFERYVIHYDDYLDDAEFRDCGELGTDNVSLPRIISSAPSPLRLTIDCTGSNDRSPYGGARAKSTELFDRQHFDVDSFCSFIHRAIPKAVKDGKFDLIDPNIDQVGFSDTQAPVAIAPPQGFIPRWGVPKLKLPKLKVPIMNVPKLTPYPDYHLAPKLGSGLKPMSYLAVSEEVDSESSAEKLEIFKKGVQKMLHVVKVLGQIDQYLSERTRIVIDKISKTLGE